MLTDGAIGKMQNYGIPEWNSAPINFITQVIVDKSLASCMEVESIETCWNEQRSILH